MAKSVVALVFCLASIGAHAATFRAVSPDGKNEIRLETGDGGMKYSVLRGGKKLVEPTEFSIHVDGRGSLNGAGAQAKATMRKVAGSLATPL